MKNWLVEFYWKANNFFLKNNKSKYVFNYSQYAMLWILKEYIINIIKQFVYVVYK